MNAKLIGVSVGPGNPDLLTLQAVKTLNQTKVIAYVKTHKDNHLALDIIKSVIDVSQKTLVELSFVMKKSPELREAQYQENISIMKQYLDRGEDVALINLGDISVYSTFSYIASRMENLGYETLWLPGVTSFCAGACAAKISLAAMGKPIHLIPGSFEQADALDLPGTKVFMKSASAFNDRQKDILKRGLSGIVIENASLPDERIRPLADVTDSGYFSLIVVKEEQ